MNKMSLPGSSTGAHRRAPCFSHTLSRNAGVTSIRFATVLGCLFAFALLCTLSIRANAAPLVDDSRPAVALAARDTVGQFPQPARDFDSRDKTTASASFKPDFADRRDSVKQSARGEHDAAIERQTWLLALAAPAVVALAGACLSRAALRRAAKKLHRAEDEWTRRCDAAEAREQGARAAASAQASAAAKQERLWLLGAMRIYAEAPLTAVAGLLESLEPAVMPSAQHARMPMIQAAVRTWSQTLHDLLDASSLESRAFVLDESATNLRELVDGVIALLSPSAVQRSLHLNSSIDQTVAERILVDSARLGQLFFHLLNRTIQLSTRGEIALVVRAEPLNAGSQRIFISVTDTGDMTAHASQLQLFGPSADASLVKERFGDADACLPLCQIFAQRMQGELAVTSDSHSVTRASFNASFTVEQWEAREPSGKPQAILSGVATQPRKASASAPSEPYESFERRNLDALSEEGIDLRAFLGGWRRSMGDDLERLGDSHRKGDIAGLRTLLHRLSGAVGLVGAHSLMEALRRASVAQSEPEPGVVEALAQRAHTLMNQLDKAIELPRSSLS